MSRRPTEAAVAVALLPQEAIQIIPEDGLCCLEES
jgi:hypothetical protein